MVSGFGVAQRGHLTKGFQDKFHVRLGLVVILATFAAAPALCAKEPWQAPNEAALRNNPLAQKKEAVARGKALYLDRCVDCHGKKGRGDGPGAADLESHPPDFSKAKVRQQTDGTFFWKISEGRKPMPAYGRKLSEEERWSLVAYVRSLCGS